MDFPTINPYSQILPGIQTGMQMAGMFPKKQNIPENPAQISDPGEFTPPAAADFLQAEYKDIMTYDRLNKMMKKAKSATPEQRKQFLENAVAKGHIQTNIGKAIVLNDDLIEPDEVINTFKLLKSNSPDADMDIDALILRLGPESAGGLAIETKRKEAIQAVEQAKQVRIIELRKTLDHIEEYHESPKDWIDKYGQMNQQTQKVLNNWKQYIKEYATLDPQGAAKWIEDQKAKRSGGSYSPTWMQGIDKRTGKMITARAYNEKDFLNQYPNADPSKIFLAGKMGEATPMVAEAEAEAKKYQKILDKLPKGNGKKLNPKKNPSHKSVIEQYLKAANGDPKEAERMAKDNNWIIE